MASQRIVIAKVGGRAADVIATRLRQWAAARRALIPDEWDPEQWPPDVHREADAFVERLRDHATEPPIVHFVEWSDLWTMGDVFVHWLTPPDGPGPFVVHTRRFELYGYDLPDAGRLARHVSGAGRQQFDEYDTYLTRLREALAAWEVMVDRAALVVIREVTGGLVTDQEVTSSLSHVPDWLV